MKNADVDAMTENIPASCAEETADIDNSLCTATNMKPVLQREFSERTNNGMDQ